MRLWEFRDTEGFKWIITENKDKTLNMEVTTYSALLPDWNLLDELQADKKLFFKKEYVNEETTD